METQAIGVGGGTGLPVIHSETVEKPILANRTISGSSRFFCAQHSPLFLACVPCRGKQGQPQQSDATTGSISIFQQHNSLRLRYDMNVSLGKWDFNAICFKQIPNSNAHSTADIGNSILGIADPDPQFHVD